MLCYYQNVDITGKRVLLFGDSQIQGLSRKLTMILHEAGAAEVDTSAHPGMSLKTAYTTLPRATAGYDVVIVSFGGNNPPPTKALAISYMRRLLDQMQGKVVLWLTVLPAEDAALQVGRGRMERWQKEYLPTKGVHVLNGRALADGLRRPDGLHLAPSSYEVLATRIATSLATIGTGLPWTSILLGALGGIALAVFLR